MAEKIVIGGKYCMRGDELHREVRFIVGKHNVHYVNPKVGCIEGVQLDGTVGDRESSYDLIPIPQPPEYIPFDDGDRDEVRGKWIKHKLLDNEYQITHFHLGSVQNMEWAQAFEHWTFLDGSIFGKAKQ